MKFSSILSLAATIGTSTTTTLFTSAQHHNLHPPSKFNGINSPTNSIVWNDVDVIVIAADAVAVDDADDVSRKLHNDNKHDMFAMIDMEEKFGLTAADGDDGGRRLSKSHKSGKGIDPEDKVLGFAFIVAGFLEVVGIIDEDDGTAFLTQLSLALTTGEDDGSNGVRKLMEGAAILDKDDIKKKIQRIIKDVQDNMMTGGRRLQNGGNNSLGLAWFLVGLLKLQGVNNETIVNERLGAFTPKVVGIIGGILGVEVPFTCPLGTIIPGSVTNGNPCCENADCDFPASFCFAPNVGTVCRPNSVVFTGFTVDCSTPCSLDSECPAMDEFCGRTVSIEQCSTATAPATGICSGGRSLVR